MYSARIGEYILNFFTHSSITPIQMIGVIEILIGLFGLYVAHLFRRSVMFRFKLAMVYTLPIIAGIMSITDLSDIHFYKHLLILTYMLFITILYWHEVKSLTTTEGYHKNSLANYLDDVPDLIWVKDADMRYTYCNKAVLKTFGFCKNEILGRTDIELGIIKKRNNERYDFDLICDKSDHEVRLSQKAQKTIESGYIRENFYSFQVYKAPILIERLDPHDPSKRHIGYIGIARDLTYDVIDHKEIEEMFVNDEIDKAINLFCLHTKRYKNIELKDKEK